MDGTAAAKCGLLDMPAETLDTLFDWARPELIQSAKCQHLSLRRLELELLFDDEDLAGRTVAQMAANMCNPSDKRDWTANFSERGLRRLIEVAAHHGFELGGSCMRAFDYNEANQLLCEREWRRYRHESKIYTADEKEDDSDDDWYQVAQLECIEPCWDARGARFR